MLDCLTLNGTYSFVNVSKNEGIQVNTTSPHAATASLDYKFTKKNYRLNAVFSASYMGRKKFDVQDRVFVEEDNKSYDATSVATCRNTCCATCRCRRLLQ